MPAFVESVPSDVYQALKLLGEFDETQGKPVFAPHLIHYPQVAGVSEENLEDKHYRWFVANNTSDSKNKLDPGLEKLKPLTVQSEKIPTLPRHDWVEDG